MITDSTLVLFFAATSSTLALVVLVISVYYMKTFEKLRHSQQANLKLRSELSQKPIRLLQEAHSKAVGIIENANQKADEILSSTKGYEANSKQNLELKLNDIEKQHQDELRKASQEIRETYQQALILIKDDNVNLLETMTKDIEGDVINEFSDFRKVLEKETIQTEKQMQEKIDLQYQEIQKEIDEYKKAKLKKVDEQILKLLYRVTELSLGKAMTFEHQEQVVLNALDEAKKENVFNNG
jgi:hypothetical protein